MKLAVMQPYVFPYLGYFQLIDSVDIFVFYDDVNFMKRSFINRNNILVNGQSKLFTIKLSKVSQNKLINETELLDQNSPLNDLLVSLKQNYKKAPYFKEVIGIVSQLNEEKHRSISDLSIKSVVLISNYLKIKTKFQLSSTSHSESKALSKSDRLVAINKKCGTNDYINAIGGLNLYNKTEFKKEGINLNFIESELKPYVQFENESIIGLSILDVLMFNSKDEIIKMIKNYKLI